MKKKEPIKKFSIQIFAGTFIVILSSGQKKRAGGGGRSAEPWRYLLNESINSLLYVIKLYVNIKKGFL